MVHGAAFFGNAAPFYTRIDYAFCHPQGGRPYPSAGSVPIFTLWHCKADWPADYDNPTLTPFLSPFHPLQNMIK